MTTHDTELGDAEASSLRLLDFRVYHSKEEFEGTCYMEIKPSKYERKYWEKGSIFIEEEAFYIFEWAFQRHLKQYDHYGAITVSSSSMIKVANELRTFEKMICEGKAIEEFRTYCRMITTTLKDDLECALRFQRKELLTAASEISEWIHDRANETRHFAILGI